MPTYHLSILSPAGKAFEGEVEAVVVPGREGQLGVLAGHTPMIAALKPGLSTITAGGQKMLVYTGEGVVEVSRAETVVLVDEASKVEKAEEAQNLLLQRLDRSKAEAGAVP